MEETYGPENPEQQNSPEYRSVMNRVRDIQMKYYDNALSPQSIGSPGSPRVSGNVASSMPLVGAPRPASDDIYSKYNIGAYPGENLAYHRGDTQSVGMRWASLVPRLALTTGTKLLSNTGFLLGLAGIDNSYTYDDNSKNWITGAADNILSDFASTMEESVKNDLFPIYKTKEYTEGNVFKQMGTASFWADDVTDGAAFMLASWGPGLGLSRLGVGSKLARAMETYAGKYGSKMINTNLPKQIDWATTTALATAGESMFEAKDTRDSIVRDLMPKVGKEVNPRTGELYTQEDVYNIAAHNAANTFKMNMGALLISNAWEAKMLFQPFKAGSVGKLLTQTPENVSQKSLTGISKYLNSRTAKIASAVARGTAVEGLWEENIQHSIQKANDAILEYGRSYDYAGAIDAVPDALKGLIDFGDKDRMKAIVLGSIIGSPVGGIGTYIQGKRDKKFLHGYDKQTIDKKTGEKKTTHIKGAVENLNNATSEFLSPKYYEQELVGVTAIQKKGNSYTQIIDNVETPITKEQYIAMGEKAGKKPGEEDGLIVIDNGKMIPRVVNGEPVVNHAWVNNYVRQLDFVGNITDTHELDELDPVRNEHALNIVKKAEFTKWVNSYLSSGYFDGAIERLDMWAKAKPEDLQKLGFDTKGKSIQQIVDEHKAMAIRIKNVYEGLNYAYKPLYTDKKNREKDTLNFIKYLEYLSDQAQYIESIDEELKAAKRVKQDILTRSGKHDPRLDEIDSLISEHQAIVSQLENFSLRDNELSSDYEEFKKKEARKEEIVKQIAEKKAAYKEDTGISLPQGMSKTNLLGSIYEAQARQQEEIIAHLETGLQTANERWAKYSNLKEGQKRYIQDMDTLGPRQSRYKITETSTKESLAAYVNSKLARSKFHIKINNEKSDRIRDAIAAELDKPGITDFEVLEIARQLLSIPVSGYTLYEDDFNKIIRSLDDIEKRFEEYESKLDNPEFLQGIAEIINAGQIDQLIGIHDESLLIEAIAYDKKRNEAAEAANMKDFLLRSKPVYSPERNKDTDEQAIRRIYEDEFFHDAYKIAADFESTENPISEDAGPIIENLKILKKIADDSSAKQKSIIGLSEFETIPKLEKTTILQEIDSLLIAMEEFTTKNNERKDKDNKQRKEILRHLRDVEMTPFGLSRISHPVFQPLMDIAQKDIAYDDIKKIISEDKYTTFIFDYLIAAVKRDGDPNAMITSLRAAMDDRGPGSLYELYEKVTAPIKENIDTRSPAFANPMDPLYSIIAKRLEHSDKAKKGEAEKQFLRDGDVAKLKDGLEREYYGSELQAYYNLIDFTTLMKSIQKTIVALQSKEDVRLKYDRFATIYETAKKNKKPIPTPLQTQVIADVSRWGNDGKLETDDFMITSGLTGSGKSSVVAQWSKELQKLTDDDIIAVSFNEKPAEVISKSVYTNPPTKVITTDELISMLVNNSPVLEGKKMIYLDEMNAHNELQLYGNTITGKKGIIDAIKDYNSKHRKGKPMLKMHLLGDPSQTAGYGGGNVIDYAPMKDSVATTNLHRTQAISSVLRSYIGALVSFAGNFMLNTTDMRKSTLRTVSSSLDPSNDTTPLYGVNGPVIAGQPKNDKETFKAQIKQIFEKRKNDNRQRLIVVSENLVPEFKSIGEQYGVPVMSIHESGGQTVDEVYIYLNWNDARAVEMNNADMYTALGRAQYYAFVGGYNILSGYQDIKEDTQARADNAKYNDTEFQNMLSQAKYILSLTSTKSNSKDKAKEPEKEPESSKPVQEPISIDDVDEQEDVDTHPEEEVSDPEREIFNGQEEDDLEPEQITPSDTISQTDPQHLHDLAFPQYGVYNGYNKRGYTIREAMAGDDVYYVYEEYVDKKKKKTYGVGVYAVTYNPDGSVEPNVYRKVGVFAPNEAEALSGEGMKLVGKMATGEYKDTKPFAKPEKLDTDGHVFYKILDVESATLHVGKLSFAQNRRFYYKSQRDENGKFILKTFKTPKEHVAYLEKIYAKEYNTGKAKKYEYAVVTQTFIKNLRNNGYNSNSQIEHELRRIIGSPILIVSLEAADNTKEDVVVFEKLAPRFLNVNRDARIINPIRAYMDNIETIEQKLLEIAPNGELVLGTIAFRKFLRAVQRFTDDTRPEDKRAKDLSDAIEIVDRYGIKTEEDLKKFLSTPGFEFIRSDNGYLSTDADIDFGKLIKYTVESVSKQDATNPGASRVVIGTAQAAMNKLAASNLFANDRFLRSWVRYPKGEDIVEKWTPKTLLGDTDTKKLLYKDIEKFIKKEQLRNPDASEEYTTAGTLMDPFTLDSLRGIFGEGAFDQAGDSIANAGYGVRLPLKKEDLQRKNETNQDFNGEGAYPTAYVGSTLDSISSAKVVVDTNPSGQQYESLQRPVPSSRVDGLTSSQSSVKKPKDPSQVEVGDVYISEEHQDGENKEYAGKGPYYNIYYVLENTKNDDGTYSFRKQRFVYLKDLDTIINKGEDKSFTEWDVKSNSKKIPVSTENIGTSMTDFIEKLDAYLRDRFLPYKRKSSYEESVDNEILFNEAMSILKSYMGDVTENDVRMLEHMGIMRELHTDAWGAVLPDSKILLEATPNGKLYSDVVRHEAFHRIFRFYFTEKERKDIMAKAEEKYGAMDSLALEERLADEFMVYKSDKRTAKGFWAKLYQRLLDLIKLYVLRTRTVEDYFDLITSGKYSRHHTKTSWADAVYSMKMNLHDDEAIAQEQRRIVIDAMNKLSSAMSFKYYESHAPEDITTKHIVKTGTDEKGNKFVKYQDSKWKAWVPADNMEILSHMLPGWIGKTLENAKKAIAAGNNHAASLTKLAAEDLLRPRKQSYGSFFTHYERLIDTVRSIYPDIFSPTTPSYFEDSFYSEDYDEVDEDGNAVRQDGDGESKAREHGKSTDQEDQLDKVPSRVMRHFVDILDNNIKISSTAVKNDLIRLWIGVDPTSTLSFAEQLENNFNSIKGINPEVFKRAKFFAELSERQPKHSFNIDFTSFVPNAQTFEKLKAEDAIVKKSSESLQEYLIRIATELYKADQNAYESVNDALEEVVEAYQIHYFSDITHSSYRIFGNLDRKNPYSQRITDGIAKIQEGVVRIPVGTSGVAQKESFKSKINQIVANKTLWPDPVKQGTSGIMQFSEAKDLKSDVKDFLLYTGIFIPDGSNGKYVFNKNPKDFAGVKVDDEEYEKVYKSLESKDIDLIEKIAKYITGQSKVDPRTSDDWNTQVGAIGARIGERYATIEQASYWDPGNKTMRWRYGNLSKMKEDFISWTRNKGDMQIVGKHPNGITTISEKSFSHGEYIKYNIFSSFFKLPNHEFQKQDYYVDPLSNITATDWRDLMSVHDKRGFIADKSINDLNPLEFDRFVFTGLFVNGINQVEKEKTVEYTQYLGNIESKNKNAGVRVRLLGTVSSDKQYSDIQKAYATMIYSEFVRASTPKLQISREDRLKSFIPGIAGYEESTEGFYALYENSEGKIVRKKLSKLKDGQLQFAKVFYDLANVVIKAQEGAVKEFEQRLKDEPRIIREKAIGTSSYDPNARNTDFENAYDRVANGVFLPKTDVATREDKIKAMAFLFTHNNWINKRSLETALFGDRVFYKNDTDFSNRISISATEGQRLALKGNYRVAVSRSLKTTLKKEVVDYLNEYTEYVSDQKPHSLTDSYGYILPEEMEKRAKAAGMDMRIKSMVKSIYFKKQGGVPVAVKYNTIVLSEEVMDAFPILRDVAEKMRDAGVVEMIDEDAFKIWKPNDTVDIEMVTVQESVYNEETQQEELVDRQVRRYKAFDPHEMKKQLGTPTIIESDAIVDLSYDGYRVIFNPSTTASVKNKYMSQFASHINESGENAKEEAQILNAYNNIMHNSTILAAREIGTVDGLRDKFSSGMERNERTYLHGLRLMNKGIDINLPVISAKLGSQIHGYVEKEIIRTRFPGGRMVLQNTFENMTFYEWYTDENDVLQQRRVTRDLKFVDKDGDMEVIVPTGMFEGIQIGQKLSEEQKRMLTELFGYRIPAGSSRAGSSVKVVGFYPTSENIVIVPKETPLMQGVDYDVDEMFFMRYSTYGEITDKSNKDLVKKGSLVFEIEGEPIHKYLWKMIEAEYPEGTLRDDRFYSLLEQQNIALKNWIIKNMVDSMRKPGAVMDRLMPLNFKRYAARDNEDGTSVEHAINEMTGRQKNSDIDNCTPVGMNRMHQEFNGADKLIGRTASAARAVSAIHRLAGDKKPMLSEETVVSISFGGKVVNYDRFSRTEIVAGENGQQEALYPIPEGFTGTPLKIKTYHTSETLLNITIDHPKLLLIDHLGYNTWTSNAYFAALSIGIDPFTTAKIFRWPATENLFKPTYGEKKSRAQELLDNRDAPARVVEVNDMTKKYYDIAKKYFDGTLDPDSVSKEDLDYTLELSKGILMEVDRLRAIGDQLKSIARITSILSQMENNYDDLRVYLNEIFNNWKTGKTVDKVMGTDGKMKEVLVDVPFTKNRHYRNSEFWMGLNTMVEQEKTPIRNLDIKNDKALMRALWVANWTLNIDGKHIEKYGEDFKLFMKEAKDTLDYLVSFKDPNTGKKRNNLRSTDEERLEKTIREDLVHHILSASQYNMRAGEPDSLIDLDVSEDVFEYNNKKYQGIDAVEQRIIRNAAKAQILYSNHSVINLIHSRFNEYEKEDELMVLQPLDSGLVGINSILYNFENLHKLDAAYKESHAEYGIYPGMFLELQKDLERYAIVKFALKYGKSPLTSLIPPSHLAQLSNSFRYNMSALLYSFQKYSYKDPNTGEINTKEYSTTIRDTFLNAFAVMWVLNHTDHIAASDDALFANKLVENSDKAVVDYGVDEYGDTKIYYSRKISKTITETKEDGTTVTKDRYDSYSSVPKVVLHWGSVYVLMQTRESTDYYYYRQWLKKDWQSHYQMSRDWMINGFPMIDMLMDPEKFTFHSPDKLTDTMTMSIKDSTHKNNNLKVGDEVLVKPYADHLYANTYVYKIEDIKPEDKKDKSFSYVLSRQRKYEYFDRATTYKEFLEDMRKADFEKRLQRALERFNVEKEKALYYLGMALEAIQKEGHNLTVLSEGMRKKDEEGNELEEKQYIQVKLTKERVDKDMAKIEKLGEKMLTDEKLKVDKYIESVSEIMNKYCK